MPGAARSRRKEIIRPLLRRCVDGLLLFSIIAFSRESLDGQWDPDLGAWRKTTPCGVPVYSIPDLTDSTAVANQLEPYWFLDKEEPADPERDMVIVFQRALSVDQNTMVLTYAVTYTDDYGSNGFGLILGKLFEVRPKFQTRRNLRTTTNPHFRDVETVRLVAVRDGDQWFLKKIVLNQHGIDREYVFGEDRLTCYQGNPAVLVELGKHATRVSPRECNRGNLLSVLGIRVGPNQCRVGAVYHPELSAETAVPYLPPGEAVPPEAETIVVQLGGETVTLQPLSQPCIARIMGICRAGFSFGETPALLEELSGDDPAVD